jgi:HlyD family secretion protein
VKRLLPFIAAVLVLAAIAGIWHFAMRGGAKEKYQTVAISRGQIVQAVTATGTLNPVVNVQVGSQISGNIEKLFADFNSVVKAGQVVAQIDPAVFQASVTQAEGDLANALAALELAKLNAKRTEALVAKQNSAQSDLDQTTAALHQAEAAVKIKQGALDKAKVDLDRCTITSPIDGIVISRNVDVGQTVAASLSAPVIFTIARDLTQMQIDANVAEADIGVVEKGLKVEFTVDAFPRRTFRGEVVQVRNAPITVQNVVTYDTVIGVANEDLKLKPGMTANVSVVIDRREDCLKIVNAALRFRPPGPTPVPVAAGAERNQAHRPPRDASGERTVYLYAGHGEPRSVQIKTGISDGVYTEVIDGLKEGDRVVTAATDGAPSATGTANNPFSGGPRRF